MNSKSPDPESGTNQSNGPTNVNQTPFTVKVESEYMDYQRLAYVSGPGLAPGLGRRLL